MNVDLHKEKGQVDQLGESFMVFQNLKYWCFYVMRYLRNFIIQKLGYVSNLLIIANVALGNVRKTRILEEN